MATNSNKVKILYLLQILQQETDEEHGLTMASIIEQMQARGISVERKSVYRDINALNEAGFKVGRRKCAPVEYYLVDDGLNRSNVMLLIDVVESCRFLTEAQCDRLTSALRNQVSEPTRDALSHWVHVENRIDGRGDALFHNVDVIHEAMQCDRKLAFCNSKLDTSGEPALAHDGKRYVQTVVELVYTNSFYYLISYSDEEQDFRHFRVDRLRMAEVSDVPATHNEAIANYAITRRDYRMFSGFSGETRQITLRVQANLMDVVADYFGLSQMKIKKLSDEEALVRVNVQESTQFYGWVAGTVGKVLIEKPASAVRRYQDWVAQLASTSRGALAKTERDVRAKS